MASRRQFFWRFSCKFVQRQAKQSAVDGNTPPSQVLLIKQTPT